MTTMAAFLPIGLILASVPGAYLYNFNYAGAQAGFGPQFPPFPPFPTIPQIVMPTMPQIVMPAFPQVSIISPEDIIKKSIGPGENFQGISVSSLSSSILGKDGKVIRNGGTTVYTRNNDVVKKYNFDDGTDINIISTSVRKT
ncbi:seroin-like [Leptidea sinapis]|uniref:seroin-like n=1 Tax=Leptidea sinapis TaxID=189913 RepID=UPI0021C300CB|nr:seroin-like [Leptidea sinapis]